VEAFNKKPKWNSIADIAVENYDSIIHFEVKNDTEKLGRGSIDIKVFALEGEEEEAVKLQKDGKLCGKLFVKGIWTLGEPDELF